MRSYGQNPQISAVQQEVSPQSCFTGPGSSSSETLPSRDRIHTENPIVYHTTHVTVSPSLEDSDHKKHSQGRV